MLPQVCDTADTFTSSITTMFHITLPEEKQLLASPYKIVKNILQLFSLIENLIFKIVLINVKNFIILKPLVILPHLITHYIEIAQNLEQVFLIHLSPKFYNPKTKLKPLQKVLSIIEENEEIINTLQRLTDSSLKLILKLGFIKQINKLLKKVKKNIFPKLQEQLEFQDFPDFNPPDWPLDNDLDNLSIQQTKLQSSKQIFVKEFKVSPMRNVQFDSNEFNYFIEEQFQPDSSEDKDHFQQLQIKPKDNLNIFLQRQSQILSTQSSKFQFPELNQHQIRLITNATICLLRLALLVHILKYFTLNQQNFISILIVIFKHLDNQFQQKIISQSLHKVFKHFIIRRLFYILLIADSMLKTSFVAQPSRRKEDYKILILSEKYKNKQIMDIIANKIAKILKRNENQVKNRFNCLLKRENVQSDLNKLIDKILWKISKQPVERNPQDQERAKCIYNQNQNLLLTIGSDRKFIKRRCS